MGWHNMYAHVRNVNVFSLIIMIITYVYNQKKPYSHVYSQKLIFVQNVERELVW